jgi:hypothetical protein
MSPSQNKCVKVVGHDPPQRLAPWFPRAVNSTELSGVDEVQEAVLPDAEQFRDLAYAQEGPIKHRGSPYWRGDALVQAELPPRL